MTPRGTDWSLAALVGLGVGTGILTFFAGQRGETWVFAAHGIAGLTLGFVFGWKLRRVWSRLARPQRLQQRALPGLVGLAMLVTVLGSGALWSSGAHLSIAGYSLLGWHYALGVAMAAIVAVHALVRARAMRVRDVANRRQFLQLALVGIGALTAWQVQRPVARALGWSGARRRFTGSYEAASFEGNAFPTTSWVADRPRELSSRAFKLEVVGLVADPLELPLAELGEADELIATLDCTGGFYSHQRWQGVRLDRLLRRAAASPEAHHLRVVSYTGYRWSFPREEAAHLLLASRVGGEPLSHEHGAPLRLVAPGHRGFQWIKWVTRIEAHPGGDLGAAASTISSSFTARGRGDA